MVNDTKYSITLTKKEGKIESKKEKGWKKKERKKESKIEKQNLGY